MLTAAGMTSRLDKLIVVHLSNEERRFETLEPEQYVTDFGGEAQWGCGARQRVPSGRSVSVN
jgi:hypothetical protein